MIYLLDAFRDASSINLAKLEHSVCWLGALASPRCSRFFILPSTSSATSNDFLSLHLAQDFLVNFSFNNCLTLSYVIQVARAILENPKDKTNIHLIYANVAYEDILLKVGSVSLSFNKKLHIWKCSDLGATILFSDRGNLLLIQIQCCFPGRAGGAHQYISQSYELVLCSEWGIQVKHCFLLTLLFLFLF